jgi:hypothetical protein
MNWLLLPVAGAAANAAAAAAAGTAALLVWGAVRCLHCCCLPPHDAHVLCCLRLAGQALTCCCLGKMTSSAPGLHLLLLPPAGKPQPHHKSNITIGGVKHMLWLLKGLSVRAGFQASWLHGPAQHSLYVAAMGFVSSQMCQ